MTYVVLFSGGHSSAKVAVEAVRKYGKENVMLLNHDISPKAELEDVKRFKREVAEYCQLPIIYANMPMWEEKDQFDVCLELGGWKFNNSPVLCTYNMKTLPFYKWLKVNVDDHKEDYTFLYGFDAEEKARMTRRAVEMGKNDYIVDFPLARWNLTIQSVEELGIKLPEQYAIFGHANCIGCLKAGRQHWYIVYCYYNSIFEKAKNAEDEIGYSILKDVFMNELEPLFERLQKAKVVPTEKIQSQTWWASAKDELSSFEQGQCKLFDNDMNMPCDCSF